MSKRSHELQSSYPSEPLQFIPLIERAAVRGHSTLDVYRALVLSPNQLEAPVRTITITMSKNLLRMEHPVDAIAYPYNVNEQQAIDAMQQKLDAQKNDSLTHKGEVIPVKFGPRTRGENEQMVRQAVHDTLSSALNNNIESVAMPLFGTGIFETPDSLERIKIAPWDSMKIMVDATGQFIDNNPKTITHDIRIIVDSPPNTAVFDLISRTFSGEDKPTQ